VELVILAAGIHFYLAVRWAVIRVVRMWKEPGKVRP